MGNVIIPAKRQVGNTARQQDAKPRLRVAAYCRVSTDSDEQATSYDAQVEHYTEFIQKNPEWEFAGIYADNGISGTNTKKREDFNRMIDDCEAGNIDMIITKSISRFARNTLDCLKYIRQLKDKNIPVFFEKEAINTMDAKGEVLITIMASLAQQESQSLPRLHQRCRWKSHHRSKTGRGGKTHLPGIPGRLLDGPDCKRSGSRQHPHRRWQNKMVDQHHQQNPPKREIHRRCPASENLYHRLPEQDQSEEQRHRATILCRRQPRSNHSKGHLLAGTGRTGTQASGQDKR